MEDSEGLSQMDLALAPKYLSSLKTYDDRLPRRAKLSGSLLIAPYVSLNWIRSCATLSPIPGICFSSSALAC